MNEACLAGLFAALLSPLPCLGDTMGTAPPLKLSNAVRLNYASSDKWLSEERHLYLATLESKAILELSPMARAAIQLRAGTHSGADGRSRLEMPFGYLDVRTDAVDVRIGKQILAWGRTDALNPTDVVTPRNYTVLLPFDEDERHGVWGVRTNIYASEQVAASLFYGLKFVPSTLPFTSRGAERYDFDAAGARRRQAGLRVSVSNDDFDFSVSAYRGASLLAQAEKAEMPGSQGALIHMHYPVITMVGADFAKNFGRYGIRIEGAQVKPRQQGGNALHGMQAYRYVVAGADRTFFSDLNINLQLFARWTERGPADAVDAGAQHVERLNNLIFVQTRRNTYGITARVANQWFNQTLTAELFLQHYFGDRSSYLHPMATYALNDHVKITAGAVWYLGKQQSLFGALKRNNALFAEWRYSF